MSWGKTIVMGGYEYLILKTVQLNPNETWNNVEKNGLLFLFLTCGGCQFAAGALTQRIRPGDVFIVGPGSGGTLTALDGKQVRFSFFTTSVDRLYPLLSSQEISVLEYVVSEMKRPKWFGATYPVAIECQKLIAEATPEPTLNHRGQLLRIAAALLSSEFKAASNKRLGNAAPDDNLMQIFERLSVDELLNLSVEELADRCNCSRRHLSRLFHQHFRFSVGALKMEIRLLKAVSLLRNPAAKVINVALECGFNHQGLFNTCFKRRFGLSPGQWRKTTVDMEKRVARVEPSVNGCQQLINGLCPLALKPDANDFVMSSVTHKSVDSSELRDISDR